MLHPICHNRFTFFSMDHPPHVTPTPLHHIPPRLAPHPTSSLVGTGGRSPGDRAIGSFGGKFDHHGGARIGNGSRHLRIARRVGSVDVREPSVQDPHRAGVGFRLRMYFCFLMSYRRFRYILRFPPVSFLCTERVFPYRRCRYIELSHVSGVIFVFGGPRQLRIARFVGC